MEDYPQNLREFDLRFAKEAECREYLRQLRWPDGFRCPQCGCQQSSPVRAVLLRCQQCRRQVSVTAGTIFQDTRIPLRLWFQAMWWVTAQKNGASALGLQHILGLSRYETAWTMLHRLRRAMVRPGRDLLSGRVEVDESYLRAGANSSFAWHSRLSRSNPLRATESFIPTTKSRTKTQSIGAW